MGLFSFAKGAGRKVFRRGGDDAGDQQEDTAAQPAVDAQPAETASATTASATEMSSAYTAPSDSGVPTTTVEMPAPAVETAAATAAATAVTTGTGGDTTPASAGAGVLPPVTEPATAAAAGADDGTVSGAGVARVYISRAGDTLDSIAGYFYGDAVHRQRLLDENPELARYEGALPGGLTIRVPEDAVPAPDAAEPVAAEVTATVDDDDFEGDPEKEARAAAALVSLIGTLGIAVEDLSITIANGTATVSGVAATQADREKAILVVGNTAGIAEVDEAIEVRAPAPEAVFYTVQVGDTLSAIAERHYGDTGRYMAIFEANQPMLTNPDLIYPGQTLRIPR